VTPAATPALSQATLAADAQAAATSVASAPPDLRWPGTLAYGALGFPLAFVALPLYVLLPHHYATEFGVALATLGALLLGARLFDALVDPWLGRASDRLYARSPRVVLGTGLVAALVLSLGLTALFFPPVRAPQALLLWAWVALVLSYLAFNVEDLSHKAYRYLT
jgi:Na+/melibiose symporter-like transporter